MTRELIRFVTGRLAEHALRSVLEELSRRRGFDYEIDVLPITVAALMTPAWIARHVRPGSAASRMIVPGYCEGDLGLIAAAAGMPVERGPRDLRQLPEYFGESQQQVDASQYDIGILAEINHAPRLPLDRLLDEARSLAADGADLIDVGCEPGATWSGVGEAVRALRDAGLRVSIDSLNPAEIEQAVRAGAELVLSVNSSNRAAAPDWGCEVVVIPDDFATLGGLEETVEYLAARRVPLRIDPVLEPIGCGFAASLNRYSEIRGRYPDAEMLMGIGNLTELTDADSAPINLLLLGICQELGIRSVLTTQVINWARTSVRECDRARRMVHYAVRHRTPPKHVYEDYILLRDAKLWSYGDEQLERLAAQIKDHNYRLFAEGGELHLVAAGMHLRDTDPFGLFEQLAATGPRNLDPAHAFYLGFELCKARIALTLGKRYEQDESLHWGFLTEPDQHHRLGRRERGRLDSSDGTGEGETSG